MMAQPFYFLFAFNLQVCAKEVSEVVANHLAEDLKETVVPLVRLVKPLSMEASSILRPPKKLVQKIASNSHIISFCATVYSCGPPL